MIIVNNVKRCIKKMIGFFFLKYYSLQMNMNKMLKGKYGSLRFIAESSVEGYRRIKKYNDTKNIERIKQNRIINVGFVVLTSSSWNVDGLYRLLAENKRFNTSVIVEHNLGEKELVDEEYNTTYSYFQANGYTTFEAKDIKDITEYDILFHLNPYRSKEKILNLFSLPLSIMILHTSYSFMLAGNENKIKAWMYHLAYKYYTDTLFYKNKIDRYKFSTHNTEFFGFAKMDQYYKAKRNILTSKKVVIYAPHHSVNYVDFKAATFEDNYQVMLELAKKYNNHVYWIYKPHPLLRQHSVEAGIFKDVKDYDRYVDEWRMLDGDVISEGEYYSTFKSSDAMITDSVSFLAEYQYTHKPLLLLESGVEKYNDFGQAIVDILYKCEGRDRVAIEKFIVDCISEKDDKYSERIVFFEKYLEYGQEKKSSCERIYRQIMEIIDG